MQRKIITHNAAVQRNRSYNSYYFIRQMAQKRALNEIVIKLADKSVDYDEVGFRKERAWMDSIFTTGMIVEKYRKLFCCFLGLRKGYDKADRKPKVVMKINIYSVFI